MARLDLHLHSTCSDGMKSPAWVVQQAAANGAELIALTDHDTLAGVAEAQAEGRRRDLEVVAGVEIGVNDPQLGELHVLGYFSADARLGGVEQQLETYRTERETRAARTVERLAKLGLEVEYETVVELAGGAAIGRPHIARAMVNAGHVESVQEAFNRYLRNDGPAYVPRTLLSLHESIEMIHGVGGFSSLAHPTRYAERTKRCMRSPRPAAWESKSTTATTELSGSPMGNERRAGWASSRPAGPTSTVCTRTSCDRPAFRCRARQQTTSSRSSRT